MWDKIIGILINFLESEEVKGVIEGALKTATKEFQKKSISAIIPNIQRQIQAKRLTTGSLKRIIKKLPKKHRRKFAETFHDYVKKNGKGDTKLEFMLNLDDSKAKLSSSWLKYGIFKINPNNKNEGHLWLGIGNKEYDMEIVKTSIWLAMLSANGKNGSGAGSVLWDTLWNKKRTKSLSTGGVRGSRKARIEAQRLINLQIARFTRQLKHAKIQKIRKPRGIMIPKIKIPKI